MDCLASVYAGSPVVRIGKADPAEPLPVERMAGTDLLELFVFTSESGDQLRLIAALDNLGKGAAGAAAQSLNLLIGAEETKGLRLVQPG
jgi:N-acetyl-gamma-glutamyl-phosphate reductase